MVGFCTLKTSLWMVIAWSYQIVIPNLVSLGSYPKNGYLIHLEASIIAQVDVNVNSIYYRIIEYHSLTHYHIQGLGFSICWKM